MDNMVEKIGGRGMNLTTSRSQDECEEAIVRGIFSSIAGNKKSDEGWIVS